MPRRSSRSHKHRLYSTKSKTDAFKAPGACIMAVLDSVGEIAVNHVDALGVALPMFSARDDQSHTPLYRASDLAHHYALKSNIVGMYLARLVNRGFYNGTIVQMREFSGEKQPPGILKNSQYFCSSEVISSFVQYMRTRRSATGTPRIGSETILKCVDDDSLVKIARIDEPVEDEDLILDAFSCDPTVKDGDLMFVEELRRMESTPDCVDLTGSNAPSSSMNEIVRTEKALLESPSLLLIDDCDDLMKFTSSS